MANDRSLTRLEVAQLWADLVSKMLGAVAIVVAAWWTYANFTVERTHDPTMVVSLAPHVHPLRGTQVLLNVDVFLENIGKVAIKPRFAGQESDRDVGLEISIVEIEPLAARNDTASPAAAEPTEASDPDVPWFDWTLGDGNPRPARETQPAGDERGLSPATLPAEPRGEVSRALRLHRRTGKTVRDSGPLLDRSWGRGRPRVRGHDLRAGRCCVDGTVRPSFDARRIA